ncbi:hypothetical protein GMDG_04744 [Pseudogymnoascus destructans 20631-21]|uniref:Uncharacterized protein n=1 Tax=Pseudogymnoascus destructans (strain ATCC MYA-4855 / 20631-21) TaxID=658429 RepID=L8GBK4_PSED2|nr:hypothetical protein GMDG_04744 [Pseudogymnoascus destructans 20631-21]
MASHPSICQLSLSTNDNSVINDLQLIVKQSKSRHISQRQHPQYSDRYICQIHFHTLRIPGWKVGPLQYIPDRARTSVLSLPRHAVFLSLCATILRAPQPPIPSAISISILGLRLPYRLSLRTPLFCGDTGPYIHSRIAPQRKLEICQATFPTISRRLRQRFAHNASSINRAWRR